MTFFFSSRRRHTRFKCDWSSDVCSSDLLVLDPPQPFVQGERGGGSTQKIGHAPLELGELLSGFAEETRSGERRVGEECRSRWAPYHLKKKNEKILGGVQQRSRKRIRRQC